MNFARLTSSVLLALALTANLRAAERSDASGVSQITSPLGTVRTNSGWSLLGPSIGITWNVAADRNRLEFMTPGNLRDLAVAFNFGRDVDLPYFYPLRSPSGASMTVERTEPYPHHRSFWFADTVQLKGQRRASFYNAWYTRTDTNKTSGPFRDAIRVLRESIEVTPNARDLSATRRDPQTASWKQVWEMDFGKTPVLDEFRTVRYVQLGGGEYFLDLTFQLTASYGDVSFESDAVHYAWPFIRMSNDFNTNSGAMLTSSTGAKGQAGTNMKPAEWMDFSKPTEGLAMFSHPSNPGPHAWLTRDYGCIGPRRVEAQSGKPFTLKQGESISTRCGVLVHTGDVQGGKVADRFKAYCDGRL